MKQLFSIQILTEYPFWFICFCFFLGVVYAFILYRKEDKLLDVKPWIIRLMASFRFLLVSILSFLLLSPFVKTIFNKVEKPLIIIVQDNSNSVILNKDSTFYKTDYIKQLNKVKGNLQNKYDVKTYTLGQDLKDGLEIDYKEKVTNLSNVFDELTNKFYNKNVGALVLASDGIFNQGINPVFSDGIQFPVYTIALGDTLPQKDLILKEVIHNKITFLGNKFPLEIECNASNCKGEKSKLLITKKGKIVFEKILEINSETFNFNESLLLEASEVGVQHYKVALSSLKNEISTTNNTKDIFIEVLDGRQNILIVSGAPHPDIKAIVQSIESNKNYKVEYLSEKEFKGNTEPYSLVIMHKVNYSEPSIKNIISNTNLSILHFLGSLNPIKFNQQNFGLTINNSRNKSSEILPSVNENFPLFALSENTIKYINSMPPLIGPFGNYKLNNEAYVLLKQKIGSVTTDDPLMLFFIKEDRKIGILAAEGIWKWRLQDFVKNKSHDKFNELINKTVQFLSVKEDKSKFRIFNKNDFFENEEIVINAELYNESYELVNDSKVKFTLIDENDNKYNFEFSKTAKSYILNAGILPSGYYSFYAETILGGKKYKQSGKFQIKPLLLEANNTVANHQLMQNIAKKFGGKLFFPKEINALDKAIQTNDNIASIIYEENDTKELINLKWLFFVLILLLSLEWFLRKRNGAY